jgi:hypothetical protein
MTKETVKSITALSTSSMPLGTALLADAESRIENPNVKKKTKTCMASLGALINSNLRVNVPAAQTNQYKKKRKIYKGPMTTGTVAGDAA